MYQIVVTEIPYQVNKSKLLEKIANAFKDKKLALLGNLLDESSEDMRIIFEPKTRNVDAEMLMESLFKLTDLETRFNLNLNVLNAQGIPKILNLQEVLQAFLDHRIVVLVRRSKCRLDKIDHRLEILKGLMIAYLNLDEVIRIIREEDQAKQVMVAKWSLTDIQAEAILNIRLRSLRKLEELAIQTELKELEDEKKQLLELLSSDELLWKSITSEIKEIKQVFGQKTPLGQRRTEIGDVPNDVVISIEAFVEREAITIICSDLGWIRAFKGHGLDPEGLKYKEGDKERFIINAYTTDKLQIFATNGRFYTIGCDKLPRAKGHGEAIRLMADIEQEHNILDMYVHQNDQKLLLVSKAGKGFIVDTNDVLANTKNGKQVLNIPSNAKTIKRNLAHICTPVIGDHVAIIGDNRKLLVINIDEIPHMRKGQGVQLQRYRDGGVSDVKTFNLADGLTWSLGERIRTEKNLVEWIGKRGHTGRMPPTGFPKKNKFL